MFAVSDVLPVSTGRPIGRLASRLPGEPSPLPRDLPPDPLPVAAPSLPFALPSPREPLPAAPESPEALLAPSEPPAAPAPGTWEEEPKLFSER
jgi:hypothetical protein